MLLAELFFTVAMTTLTAAPALPPEKLMAVLPRPASDGQSFWVLTQTGPVHFTRDIVLAYEASLGGLKQPPPEYWYTVSVWEARLKGCVPLRVRAANEMGAILQIIIAFRGDWVMDGTLRRLQIVGVDYLPISVWRSGPPPAQRAGP